MSQPQPALAEREHVRRRNTGVAMGFAALLCLVGVVWASTTLGAVGDQAAVELVPETAPAAAPGATAAPVDPAAPPVDPAAPITRFVSPTGNIACVISTELARCDVAEKTWDAGAPPAECAAVFGAGVQVDSGGPRLTCAADSLVGAGGGALEYGRDVTVGDFSCSSSEAGIRCTQASTGVGFSVSRRAYTFF